MLSFKPAEKMRKRESGKARKRQSGDLPDRLPRQIREVTHETEEIGQTYDPRLRAW